MSGVDDVRGPIDNLCLFRSVLFINPSPNVRKLIVWIEFVRFTMLSCSVGANTGMFVCVCFHVH